ncbi:hypothetical protein ACJQWK_03881 [Exserohilum turcicum]
MGNLADDDVVLATKEAHRYIYVSARAAGLLESVRMQQGANSAGPREHCVEHIDTDTALPQAWLTSPIRVGLGQHPDSSSGHDRFSRGRADRGMRRMVAVGALRLLHTLPDMACLGRPTHN